jgi:curved DNA-binding protein CbpA
VADAFDPYKTLQVDAEADDEVIRAAYRGLARKYHPDVTPGADAAARMAAINVAWGMIGEPDARRRYDQSRAGLGAASRAGMQGARPGTAAPTPPAAREPAAPKPPPPPEEVSRDWTSGRSSTGSGYDPSMRSADGHGAAGRPPGNPSGSVLNFGRYAGWSLGEIARSDIEYIEWLDRAPIGRQYRDEVDQILRKAGRRVSESVEQRDRRGLYRRR